MRHQLAGAAAEPALLQNLFPDDAGLISPLAGNDYRFIDPVTPPLVLSGHAASLTPY